MYMERDIHKAIHIAGGVFTAGVMSMMIGDCDYLSNKTYLYKAECRRCDTRLCVSDCLLGAVLLLRGLGLRFPVPSQRSGSSASTGQRLMHRPHLAQRPSWMWIFFSTR